MFRSREVYVYKNSIKNARMQTEEEHFDEWMTDYISGHLSGENLQKFHTLLKSDALYRERFKKLSQAHARLLVPRFAKIEAQNYEKLLRRLNLKPENTMQVRLRPWKKLRRIAAAVAFAIASSLIGYYLGNEMQQGKPAPALCRMEVPLGSQTKAVLPDGTVVRLNSGSVLKYDPAFINKKNREVYLTGEGYFEVHKSPHKPFIVHTEDLNIKVLGTVFNIRAYPEEPNIQVALIAGKVNVFSRSETQGNVLLKPDQQAVYEKRSGKLFSEAIDAAVTARWTTGRLSFVNASLPAIMKDIERKFDVRIAIGSEKMKSEIFSGSIGSELSLEEILDYLDVDGKYEWTRQGNVITITDK